MTVFGNAWIVFDFVVFVPFLFVFRVLQESFQFFVGIDDHSAEFEHFEGFAMLADAGLRIDDAMKIACTEIDDTDDNI